MGSRNIIVRFFCHTTHVLFVMITRLELELRHIRARTIGLTFPNPKPEYKETYSCRWIKVIGVVFRVVYVHALILNATAHPTYQSPGMVSSAEREEYEHIAGEDKCR